MDDPVIADKKKRARDASDESDPDVKRVRAEELLGSILDDSDSEPASHDLDSVIKSFEDELTSSTSLKSGDSRPDLGYLLEASDDELGLPPPPLSQKEDLTELVRVSSDSSGIGEFWEFEDQIPSYDSFDLSVGQGYEIGYVAVDGLFEYSDTWLPETLPAERI